MTPSSPVQRADLRRLAAWVLVLFGAAWLLTVTGFVPERFVLAASLLWPLVAIGLGLDLLGIRKLPSGIPYGVLALVVIAVVGLFFADPAARLQREPAVVSEPIGDANRAEVHIDAAATPLLVRAGTPEGVLVEATAIRAAEIDLAAAGRSVRRVKLAADENVRGGAPREAATEVRLTDRIPLELEVAGRDHATNLDLTGLDLAGFRYVGAAGPAQITLGGVGPERYDAHVVGGSGPLDITIPAASRLNLRLEPGAGGAAVAVGARSDLTLVLRAGDGPVALALPEDARIRVAVDDPEQGVVSLSNRIQRVRGAAEGEDEAVYQTAGYRDVIPTIDIRIEETGEGPIAIR